MSMEKDVLLNVDYPDMQLTSLHPSPLHAALCLEHLHCPAAPFPHTGPGGTPCLPQPPCIFWDTSRSSQLSNTAIHDSLRKKE